MPNRDSVTSVVPRQQRSRIEHKIPDWAVSLVDIGEKFVTAVDEQQSRCLTVALCLPCIDYAAAFIGIGIVKARLATSSAGSQRERLASLVGHWVSLEGKSETFVGILEFSLDDNSFQIKIKKHGLWIVLRQKDWPRVRPTGREFNKNQRVSKRQIQRIKEQNQSISALSDFFSCDLRQAALDGSGGIFNIYGNKTRLTQELSESLFADEEASLGKILRPEGDADYGESFHCSLEVSRSPIPDQEGVSVIVEASRSLPDQLVASRKLNRIILLGRNTADYGDCAGQVMEESTLRGGDFTELGLQLPPSITHLAFYHR